MSFIGNIAGNAWSNLTFNAGSATASYVNALNWRYANRPDANIEYLTVRAYSSLLVHIAKQMAISTLESELNSILPKYQKYIQQKNVDYARQQQMSNLHTLIERQQIVDKNYGVLTLAEGKTFSAVNPLGVNIPDALFLSYDGDTELTYAQTTEAAYDVVTHRQVPAHYTITRGNSLLGTPDKYSEVGAVVAEREVKTKTVFFYDLAPEVQLSSAKNLVCTQVQGRDYTRKELVSGGDLTFSVSGNLVSNYEGVYPEEMVSRFIMIMQYAGIVNVHHRMFGDLGVKKVVIKDFNLGRQEYKNIQPYSFTCVAVESDESLQAVSDTITAINAEIEANQTESLLTKILANKWGQLAANTVANAVTSAATSSAAAGLDSLTTNI